MLCTPLNEPLMTSAVLASRSCFSSAPIPALQPFLSLRSAGFSIISYRPTRSIFPNLPSCALAKGLTPPFQGESALPPGLPTPNFCTESRYVRSSFSAASWLAPQFCPARFSHRSLLARASGTHPVALLSIAETQASSHR